MLSHDCPAVAPYSINHVKAWSTADHEGTEQRRQPLSEKPIGDSDLRAARKQPPRGIGPSVYDIAAKEKELWAWQIEDQAIRAELKSLRLLMC